MTSPQSAEDGALPRGNLLMDSTGALYGTTGSGGSGSQGVIYKLAPSADGSSTWDETILHTFTLEGGEDPFAGVIADASGALYGTTFGGGSTGTVMYGLGTVFKLTPPPAGQADWSYEVLHVFTQDGVDGFYPISKLAMDSKGNLFGVTQDSSAFSSILGTVFEVSPPVAGQSNWTEKVIMNFTRQSTGKDPRGGLAVDATGTIYGNTASGGLAPCQCGTVFSLKPLADGSYHYTLLYSFSGVPDGAGPGADVTLDAAGNIYGTTGVGGVVDSKCTTGCGTVYKLTRPTGGEGAWTENVYASTTHKDGKAPQAGVLIAPDGRLYGTASEGGAFTQGSVFSISGSKLGIH